MCFFFFFNDTATTEIYTLSLHDALPILDELEGVLRTERVRVRRAGHHHFVDVTIGVPRTASFEQVDRKSTRLNSSHSQISYAVFCLKKKKKQDKKMKVPH